MNGLWLYVLGTAALITPLIISPLPIHMERPGLKRTAFLNCPYMSSVHHLSICKTKVKHTSPAESCDEAFLCSVSAEMMQLKASFCTQEPQPLTSPVLWQGVSDFIDYETLYNESSKSYVYKLFISLFIHCYCALYVKGLCKLVWSRCDGQNQLVQGKWVLGHGAPKDCLNSLVNFFSIFYWIEGGNLMTAGHGFQQIAEHRRELGPLICDCIHRTPI